jgi:hypothetical protein
MPPWCVSFLQITGRNQEWRQHKTLQNFNRIISLEPRCLRPGVLRPADGTLSFTCAMAVIVMVLPPSATPTVLAAAAAA